ncbi:hypothetical protein HNQ91_002028 [Filimonas zeae]|nr:hypothetical protein [Filimonas zeae]MDR6338977.1 hypothetical protein [Filimonas zeae]
MQQALTVNPVSFRQFVFVHYKQQLLFSILGMLTLFIVYKILYPFPDTYVDSFHYLSLAEDGNYISVWPMGYSYFLRAVHFITPSHLFLITVQFALLQGACLWMAFTLFYLFQPDERLKNAVLIFLVFNPMSYYLANLISSDVFFAALSVAWLTILVKMLYEAQYWHILLQGPLLAYLFLVRYQAAYYPIIMIVALWLAPINRVWKVLSATIGVLLLVWIVNTTLQKNLRQYGRKEFSAQSGWILASNALFMYPYIRIDTAAFQGERLQQMDQVVSTYFKANDLMQHPFYPWDGPQYMLGGRGAVMWYHLATVEEAAQPDKPVFWLYNRMGVHWANYAKALIKQHPWAYVQYYLLPNVITYFLPVIEQFTVYSMGRNKVPTRVARWFGRKDRYISAVWPKGSYYLLWGFRPLFLLLNLVLLVCGIQLLKKRKQIQMHPVQQKILIVLGLAFVGNAALLIISIPVMLRYQAFALFQGVLLLLAIIAVLQKNAKLNEVLFRPQN